MARDRHSALRLTKNDYRLFPKGYWESPIDDPTKRGDHSVDYIHLAVGRALSAWECVEERIATLFMRLADDFDPKGHLAKTFGSIESIATRLKVTMDAAERCFGEHWLRDEINWRFDALRVGVIAASQRRNEIAHGIGTHFRFVVLPPNSIGFRSGAFLVAPGYMTGRNMGPNSGARDAGTLPTSSLYCYNSTDIMNMAQKFGDLSSKVVELVFAVNREPDGIPKMLRELLDADTSILSHFK